MEKCQGANHPLKGEPTGVIIDVVAQVAAAAWEAIYIAPESRICFQRSMSAKE